MTETRQTTGTPEPSLRGRSVVVTRAAEQAAGLAEPLRAHGAEVLVLPVIRIADPESWEAVDAAIQRLDSYDQVILTSVNGVDRFADRLRACGRDIRELAGDRVAVVGEATARRLRELGVEPGIVPVSYRAEGLVEVLRERCGSGCSALVPRAATAREVLPDDLRSSGWTVDVVPVYRLVAADPDPAALGRLVAGEVDAVTFASGGTARHFVEVLEREGIDVVALLRGVVVASIGPVTSEALRGLGIEPDVEAPKSTSEALAEALAARLREAVR